MRAGALIEREATGLHLRFDPTTLAGHVVQTTGGAGWRIDLAEARGVACGAAEPMFAELPWVQHCRAMQRLEPLRPEQIENIIPLPNGVALDFRVGGASFRIVLELCDRPAEFVFRLQPLATGRNDLIAAELPGPILPAGGEPVQVLMDWRHQGRLFTGAPGPLDPHRPEARELTVPDGQHRLRFFGVLGDRDRLGAARAGYVVIIEENADALLVLRQGDGGRLSCSTAWLPSMGTLSYERILRYRFEDRPTTTTLAKSFRRYAMDAGLFKSLKEKIAERPALGNLIGATACFIGYEASTLDYIGTFRHLREMGHKRFYVFPIFHINCGFGSEFAGMKLIDIRAQADALRQLGATVGSWTYISGLADRPELIRLAARNPDGTTPLNWRIGKDVWPQFCQRQAVQFLAGCGELLTAADAHHFDVTASGSLMECYAPTHPLDRRGDRACRIAQFQEAARHGCVVASEGVRDWAVPYYDMGSNKEVPVRDETPAYRILPLQHLVYHDAIFSLWWEVHPYDCSWFGLGGDPLWQSLTDLLYGDMPLIFPVGRQYRWKGEGMSREAEEFEQYLDLPLCREAAERAVAVADSFGRVATEEMTDFAWLSEDGRVQQTHFANGVSVVANFGGEPFAAPDGRIVPPLAALVLE